MCWSGSRASRRAMSSQNRGSKSASATRCSWLRGTSCRCAAISSASARGDSMPACASRAVAIAISSSRRVIPDPPARPRPPAGPGPRSYFLAAPDLLGPVGLQERVDHGIQVTVDVLVQVVGLEAHPVIGDPVLREVIGAHPLRAVHVRYLAAAAGRGLRVRLLLGHGQHPRPQDPHRGLLVLELALLVLA